MSEAEKFPPSYNESHINKLLVDEQCQTINELNVEIDRLRELIIGWLFCPKCGGDLYPCHEANNKRCGSTCPKCNIHYDRGDKA